MAISHSKKETLVAELGEILRQLLIYRNYAALHASRALLLRLLRTA